MANIAGFNAAQYGEMRSFSAVPAHKALMMIVNSALKPTKDATGQQLSLEMDILEGQYKGRKIFVGLNMVNKSKQSEDIAARELATICKAIGKITPADSSELHNLPFIGDIGVKKNRETKEDENHMKGYEPATSGATTAPAPAPVGAAPAPAAPSTPPWARK